MGCDEIALSWALPESPPTPADEVLDAKYPMMRSTRRMLEQGTPAR